jgi:hypothetical protein
MILIYNFFNKFILNIFIHVSLTVRKTRIIIVTVIIRREKSYLALRFSSYLDLIIQFFISMIQSLGFV